MRSIVEEERTDLHEALCREIHGSHHMGVVSESNGGFSRVIHLQLLVYMFLLYVAKDDGLGITKVLESTKRGMGAREWFWDVLVERS